MPRSAPGAGRPRRTAAWPACRAGRGRRRSNRTVSRRLLYPVPGVQRPRRRRVRRSRSSRTASAGARHDPARPAPSADSRQHRVHLGGVRGVVHRQIRRARTPSASQAADSSSSASGSPETTVGGGPFTAATDTRSPHGSSSVRDLRPRQPATDDHAALAGQRLHQPAAQRPPPVRASSSDSTPATHAAAISPCEWPTTASGRDPGDRHSRGQRHHHRQQHRLHHVDPVQHGASSAPAARRAATSPRTAPAPRAHSVDRARRTPGRTSQQLRAPSRPTATLPGEHEHRPARRRATPATTCRRRLAVGQRRASPAQQLVAVGADHHRPVLERGAGGRQRAGHVDAGELRVAPATCRRSRAACAAQRRRGVLAGQHATARSAAGGGAGRAPVGSGRTGRGACSRIDVRVGAADPERRHRGRGAAGRSPARAGLGRAAAPPRPTSPRAASARRRAGSAAARRAACAMHHLDHPGHAGGGLGVADVRLHRAQPQRPVLGPVLPVGGQQRLRLDRVAQRRCRCRAPPPRPRRRADSPALASACADHPLLRRAVRRGQAVATRRPG